MDSITVKGSGRASAQPDTVTLSFGVAGKARDYADCIDGLNRRAAALRQNLKTAGADDAELKTANFSVKVEQRYEKKQYVFDGYLASHRLEIELPVDKDMLNRVLGTVAQGHSGAEIQIYFSVKDTQCLRLQALAEAVREAKLNAESLAQAAGVKLVKLRSMEHGWNEVRVSWPTYGFTCESVAEYAVDLDPKDVSVSESVTLVYEIEG